MQGERDSDYSKRNRAPTASVEFVIDVWQNRVTGLSNAAVTIFCRASAWMAFTPASI